METRIAALDTSARALSEESFRHARQLVHAILPKKGANATPYGERSPLDWGAYQLVYPS